MSLNQVVSQTIKPWMNISASTITVDNLFDYKILGGSPGDYLTYLSGVIAWRPLTAGVFGNQFAAVLINKVLNSTFSVISFPYALIPYSGLYTYNRGGSTITVNQNGEYYIYCKFNARDFSSQIDLIVLSNNIQIGYAESYTYKGSSTVSNNSSSLLSFSIALNAGDVITIKARQENGTETQTIIGVNSCIGIIKLN